MLIICISPFLNLAQGKSSWHIPLLTSDSVPANSEGGGSSNFNNPPNPSFFTSHTYLVHPSSVTLGGNITNNKVIMIGFDDGWKGQIIYAKPILDKYGFKASFFRSINKRINFEAVLL